MLLQRLSVFCALVAAGGAVYAIRITDADLWGHLRYGRLLVDNGGRIPEDPFAYTTADRTWNDHESLVQMLYWLSYRHGGPVGLIVLKCLLGAGAIACLYSCLRLGLSDARVWGPLLMITAVSLGRWFLFRPQLFTYLFLGLTVRLVVGHLLGRRGSLWPVPLILLLWTNLHGGFLAGLGVLGLGLGLRAVQAGNRSGLAVVPMARAVGPLTLTLLISLASTLINPLGWHLWPYLVTELGHSPNKQLIKEWMPLLSDGIGSWSAQMVYLPLGILILFGGLAQVRGRRIADIAAWQWLLSCVPLTVLAFASNRHAPVLIIWLAPVLGLLVGAALEGREGQTAWSLPVALLWALAFMPAELMLSLIVAEPGPRIAVPVDSRAPPGLVAFLRANDLRGNLYAPLWWGSSLTWETYPNIRVAMDGRNVTLFATEDVTANLFFFCTPDGAVDTPLRYPTDYLALPPGTAVLERVRSDSRWVLLFEDAEVVLFVRADAGHADLVRRKQAGELVRGDMRIPLFLE